MVVSELIEVLKRADANAVVELNVYGHVYNSRFNRRSHGPIKIFENPDGTLSINGSAHPYKGKWVELGSDQESV